jgi:SAM-dependent methyltransferase
MCHLPKTYRAIQQWDQWLENFPGNSVLEAEKNFLPSILSQFYGTQSLLIGSPRQFELLKSSVIPSQILLSPLLSHLHHKNIYSIESGLHELPVASGSIDLVMLPHILEHIDNPRQALAEACRIVKPQGHIVLFGFNPYSLWGLKKLWTRHKNNPPWSGNFFSSSSIKEWLTLADFELIKHKTLLFRPPVNARLYKKLEFMEWIGRKLNAPIGGIYLIVAQAKVIPLTPIKLTWKQKLSDVRLPIMGVPRPTIRNQR